MFGNLFGRKKKKQQEEEEQERLAEEFDKKKSEYMEYVLGKEHDMVMHAIFPYALGGGLDLYYYPNGVAGTGIGTKELAFHDGGLAANKMFDSFEWVMFTRHELDLDAAKDDDHPFGVAHSNMNTILNMICRYSEEAALSPNETCEFPEEMENVGGKCLIFDAYSNPKEPGPGAMGLMLIIEIFRSEMEYAREHGGSELIGKLKEAGHYPYSDLDRDPVA